MKIKSLSDIPEALFYPIKKWVDLNINNFHIFLVGILLLIFLGLVLCITYSKKIGKADERTVNINLKSCYYMLITIVVCDIIFPTEYLHQQFAMLKYGIALIVSGLYLFLQYRKDLK